MANLALTLWVPGGGGFPPPSEKIGFSTPNFFQSSQKKFRKKPQSLYWQNQYPLFGMFFVHFGVASAKLWLSF